MRPEVRDLNKLVSQQNKALKPMYNQINSDIRALETSGQAQEAGLAAQKDAAFGQIEQASSDKGMLWSGFSPDEQATYLASTYMPALAEMQSTIANARSGLMREKIGLGKQAFDTAFQTRESDIGRRFTYDERISSQKFQAKEASKQRQFTAAENARDRASSAANAATAAAKQDYSGVVNAVKSYLDPRRGGDKKVSPATFQEGRNIWVKAGGDPSAYAQAFIGYVNRSHESDYF